MKPKILLRAAAVLMLLHTIGHTFGALGWAKAPNTKVAAVISGMQNEHFDFMGRSVTLAQFYIGYGISMILILLYFSLQLWLLAISPTRPMLLLTALLLSGLAVCEYVYFFPFAALFTAIAAACTWLSFKQLPQP
ncbi:hypothetical protein ACFS5N_06145 [Mucilaginibacter ximonensis]|uniref:DoxX-like protein n=1 Tax=Mucilaginibacter ximonensis TaxID=538021 RepID=A0ABW5Y9J3_9SPHI